MTSANGKFDPRAALADLRHEFGEHGGVNLSIEASTTFTVLEAETMPELFSGRVGPEGGCYLYGRHFNPTVYTLGKQLAAIENTGAGYATASGMGAIAAALMQLCDAGDHVVSGNTVYGGTFALLNSFLPAKAGVTTTFVDVTDHAAVERAFRGNTRALYVESIANPTLVVSDIPALAAIAHRHGAALIVDNTFSPMLLTPANLGADIVVHSLTKFINGASDIIAGAVCGTQEFIGELMDLQLGTLMLLGSTMDARTAFNISMRVPHLGLRIVEHSRRAMLFAQRLSDLGLPVVYPGLADHPQHALLASMVNEGYGFGGVFGLDLGTSARAERFMETLQNEHGFGFMAVSLGFFDTLMSCSGETTSSELSEADRREAGIPPGYVRISIGYTGSVEQRWAQFASALERVGAPV
ncbi:MAG: aminotransferase class V-fold PLP-dependent enzyme [Phycisphaeraceae bacterium]|nr:aminotransferase class V-fold PLP-dependent enzyme [Phycisphaeraceae bacterium]MCB9847224.1 aminotransferase class V-fold PLP-dependent enzyme [Phycisphaeraceae bacterium]